MIGPVACGLVFVVLVCLKQRRKQMKKIVIVCCGLIVMLASGCGQKNELMEPSQDEVPAVTEPPSAPADNG